MAAREHGRIANNTQSSLDVSRALRACELLAEDMMVLSVVFVPKAVSYAL